MCLDITVQKKPKKGINISDFFIKNPPLLLMTALTNRGIISTSLYKVSYSKEASPISLQRMMDKMFLFFDPDLPKEVQSG